MPRNLEHVHFKALPKKVRLAKAKARREGLGWSEYLRRLLDRDLEQKNAA